MSSTQYTKKIALVDCNSFYVSCERLFNPKIRKKPVVVLSNNDGCIISRSTEAKALGIKMGEPYFKAKDIIIKNKVEVFSSNYSLYGDLSRRVMRTLKRFNSAIEVYSIDEAFLDLSNFSDNEVEKVGREIRETVLKWTGIPTSIGIAKTKTLSKVANHIAKKKGYIIGVLGPDDFKLTKGEDKLSLYQFYTNTAKHYFCSICGIHTHNRPRSNPKIFGVNIACIEGVEPFEIEDVPVNDGKNHPLDQKK